jgi:hypothetical protein
MKEINWQKGDFSGKAYGILFLLVTQGVDTVNFEIRLRALNRTTQKYSWEKTDLSDSNDEQLQILGYIPLTQALEWATGIGEFPYVIDTKIRTLLAWEEGQITDTCQSYIVSLASQFDMQHYVDGEWLHPHQSEMKNGYSKFIPTKTFIQYIRTYLPFN